MPLFAILTLFPEAVEAYAACGMLRVAREKGLAQIQCYDFRDFTRDRHRTVDDRPFGGGPGMLLKPEPIAECIEWVEARHGVFRKFALCPAGRTFGQALTKELAHTERLLFLCGRYEGFDARLIEHFGFEELSLGDFVLAGGELAALCMVEALVRQIPGVLGHERSALEDSFVREGGLLDHPHYTRPRNFRGREVPEVLLGGDHARVEAWRSRAARERTRERRPDLLEHADARRTHEHSRTDRDPEAPTHTTHKHGPASGGTELAGRENAP